MTRQATPEREERLLTPSPPPGEGAPQDSTRPVAPEEAVIPGRGPFQERAQVRITLLRTHRPRGDRLGELGTGCLLDRVAVGRPLRVAIQGGPAFVTSMVRGLQRLAPDAVQVVTQNSVYRIKRVAPARPPAPPLPRPLVPGREQRLAELRQRAREASATRGGALRATTDRAEAAPPPGSAPEAQLPDDSSRFVPLAVLGRPGRAPFGPGTRLRISRTKTRDRLGEQLGDLGPGRSLDRLEVGQPARLALDGGPTLVTSPVRSIHLLGSRSIEIVTANSSYRLERIHLGQEAKSR